MALCEHGYTLNWDCPICETGEQMPPGASPQWLARECPYCGRMMSDRESEARICDDCAGGQ